MKNITVYVIIQIFSNLSLNEKCIRRIRFMSGLNFIDVFISIILLSELFKNQ